MQIRKLDAPFGAEISGIDLADGIDEHGMRALTEALYENRMIVIRGQSLTPEQYLAFGRQWGTPRPHVLSHLRMKGYPELLEIGNTAEHAKDDENRNGAVFWHTDQSYEIEPVSTTMLYSLKVPRTGGETMLADMVAAYEALDPETKEDLDRKVGLHFYGGASGRGDEKIAAPLATKEQVDEVPPCEHPIVRQHPVTGHKALYAVAGTAIGVDGMADQAGQALLARLKAHVTQDRFIYKHKYEIGDIAMWDTLSTLHSAVPIDLPNSPEEERLLLRISVKGLPAIYQH